MSQATITDVNALPDILTVRHIQAFLGVAKVTAYELTQREDFPAIRFGRAIRVSKSAFLQYLEAHAGANVLAREGERR